MAAGKIVLYTTSNGNSAIQKVASLITARVQFSVAPPANDTTDKEWVIAAVMGNETNDSEIESL